jgi:hypothetical protein
MYLNRRGMLRSLAVLAGVGGAGCFGGDTETPGTESDGGNGGSPTESPTPTATPNPTPTYTTVCGVCTDRSDLLVERTAPEATPGSTVTVAATFRNPYSFEVGDIEVALTPPTDEWTVSPAPVTFEAVPAGAQRDVEWEVTIPDSATGEYTLTTVTSFRGPGTDYTVRTNHVAIHVADS